MKNTNLNSEYRGFEQGPIRPPSEAGSLLIRVTRNCPWNRCTFCPVYKGSRFSLRPASHVLQDIDAVYDHVMKIRETASGERITQDIVQKLGRDLHGPDLDAFHAALHWMAHGSESVFLQDANSLIMKPEDLILVLRHIRKRFPWIDRITSYARSRTVQNIADEDIMEMAEAGLNRIHIGMESACDAVLERVKKGVTREAHIIAGKKIKAAGISLSEYVMPGLGGRELSRSHALDTADALNQINPDFIRLRTLALPRHTELCREWEAGGFKKCTDAEVAEEIRLLIENLEGITSTLTSDHILNLFETVSGKISEKKPAMLAEIQAFLDLPKENRMIYQLGRRLGYFRGMKDFENPAKRESVASICRSNGVTPENVEGFIDDLMRRFV
ncbi:radical SAM protein [Desulfococcaceae bacterium OttesenSCG-928-F15]|nr:radical SAM protein [Desulfococcaceae bacterium OttesenSCG-928-F15]